MAEMKKKIDEMKAEIEQLRDELQLKAHLGQADAKDELVKLEQRWDALRVKYKPLTDELGQTAENTGAALGLALAELKQGVDRIRKLL
jgi:archaellum component FlaC